MKTETGMFAERALGMALCVLALCSLCFQDAAAWQEDAFASEDAVAGSIGAPSALRVRVRQNGFQLSWMLSPNDPGAVTAYEIVRSDRFSGPYDPVAMVEKGTAQYVDETALPEIIYFYKVRALAAQASSPFSITAAGER